jgi:hypothetical protein
VRGAAYASENHPSLAQAISRCVFLFPGNNLRSADSSSPWSFKHPLGATRPYFDDIGRLILQRLRKIHCAMLEAENFQPHSGEAVEN